MHVTAHLDSPPTDHPHPLFDGHTRPSKKPMPRGLEVLRTPSFDLPSGIPIEVYVEYDPAYDTGILSVYSAGVELARVAPLRLGSRLMIRLQSDELLWIDAFAD